MQDSIRYSVYLVSSFVDIHSLIGASLSNLNGDNQPIVVLLFNWGSPRDLRKSLNLRYGVQIFVIDRHRLVHLHNLSNRHSQETVLYTSKDESQSSLSSDDETGLNSDSDQEEEEEPYLW